MRPSAISVTFGGNVLLTPSPGEPAIASGYGPAKIITISAASPNNESSNMRDGLPRRLSRQA